MVSELERRCYGDVDGSGGMMIIGWDIFGIYIEKQLLSIDRVFLKCISHRIKNYYLIMLSM